MSRKVTDSRDYTVTREWSTALEPGSWLEFGYADERRRHLIAGFVFIPHYKPSGGVDVHAVWDYRDVDGARLPRLRDSMRWGDRVRYDRMIAGFDQAAGRYRECAALAGGN